MPLYFTLVTLVVEMSASVEDVKLPVVFKYGSTTKISNCPIGKVGKAILSVYGRMVKIPGNVSQIVTISQE